MYTHACTKRFRAVQLVGLCKTIRNNNLPAEKRLLEDDPDLPSQANVRDKLAHGIFSIRVYIHVYMYYIFIHTIPVCIYS